MEFVLVTFPRVRPVRMDGATQGQTGQVIAVQRGVHIFDLGSPLDYTPPSVQTPVANTTSGAPLVVAFQSAAFAPSPSPPPMPSPPAAMAVAPSPSDDDAPSTARRAAGRKKSVSRKKTAPSRKAASRKSTARKKKTASRKEPAARKKPAGEKRAAEKRRGKRGK